MSNGDCLTMSALTENLQVGVMRMEFMGGRAFRSGMSESDCPIRVESTEPAGDKHALREGWLKGFRMVENARAEKESALETFTVDFSY